MAQTIEIDEQVTVGALAPALAYRNFVFFRLNFIAAA